MLTSNRC